MYFRNVSWNEAARQTGFVHCTIIPSEGGSAVAIPGVLVASVGRLEWRDWRCRGRRGFARWTEYQPARRRISGRGRLRRYQPPCEDHRAGNQRIHDISKHLLHRIKTLAQTLRFRDGLLPTMRQTASFAAERALAERFSDFRHSASKAFQSSGGRLRASILAKTA
jgi:hypothetical protein